MEDVKVSKKKLGIYIRIFIISVITYLICTPLRGYLESVHASQIETVCYAIVTYLVLRKYSLSLKDTFYITVILLLGRVVLEIPIRIIDFAPTLSSLPNTLLACLAIVLTAFAYAVKKPYVYIIAIIIWGFFAFFGHAYILECMN